MVTTVGEGDPDAQEPGASVAGTHRQFLVKCAGDAKQYQQDLVAFILGLSSFLGLSASLICSHLLT